MPRDAKQPRQHILNALEALQVTEPPAQAAEKSQALLDDHMQRLRKLVEDYERSRAMQTGVPYNAELINTLWALVQKTPPTSFSPPATAEQFGLDLYWAHTLAHEFGTRALELPIVRDVAQRLGTIIEDRLAPQSLRAYAQTALRTLFDRMVPAIESTPAGKLIPSWTAPTREAMYWRVVLLECYEFHHKRLTRILRRTWNNPALRLRALREAYPTISDQDLRSWNPQACARIAHKLAGKRFGLTATTVRKYLQQARKDRQRHFTPEG